jgi:hypothetical protein
VPECSGARRSQRGTVEAGRSSWPVEVILQPSDPATIYHPGHGDRGVAITVVVHRHSHLHITQGYHLRGS